MRTALVILGLVALAPAVFADSTPPPQAPPVRVKVVPPQAPPLVATEVRVAETTTPQATVGTELTEQMAITEAKRRWGSGGAAWADKRDLAGVVWLRVGIRDAATGKSSTYGRGMSWQQAFRDAELNRWPEVKNKSNVPLPLTTLEGAIDEARRRWGTQGIAWLTAPDRDGTVWHCVGIRDAGDPTGLRCYGAERTWPEAFRSADSNATSNTQKAGKATGGTDWQWDERRGVWFRERESVPAPERVPVPESGPEVFYSVPLMRTFAVRGGSC